MTNFINEGIQGFIDHEYKKKKIRLHGTVLGVNEADHTAKMRFDNGVFSDGIPMESIILDEGVLDGIKKNAARAWGWIKGKFSLVNGVIRKIVNGFPIPFNRASNIGALNAKGGLPEGVTALILSDAAKAEAAEAGVAVKEKDDVYVEDENNPETQEINNFWHKLLSNYEEVLKHAEENIDNLEDATNESVAKMNKKGVLSKDQLKNGYLQLVKEQYGEKAYEDLQDNPSLKEFFGDVPSLLEMQNYALRKTEEIISLNEATKINPYIEDNNQDAGVGAYKSENIVAMDTKEIVDTIMRQLSAAYQTGEFDRSNPEVRKRVILAYANQSYERYLKHFDKEEAKRKAFKEAKAQFAYEGKAVQRVKPLLVWGAPGVGKTSIIQQTRGMFKEYTKGSYGTGNGAKEKRGINISMIEVVLSKMTEDSFQLNTLNQKGDINKTVRADAAPQSWLPVWQVTGTASIDRIRDRNANFMNNTQDALNRHGYDSKTATTRYEREMAAAQDDDYPVSNNEPAVETPVESVLPTSETPEEPKRRRGRPRKITESEEFVPLGDADIDADDEIERREAEAAEDDDLTDGGILFFDELSRATPRVMNVVMNLFNDRKLGEGWVLGSHWVMVAAANRFYEMNDAMDSTWENAYGTRFIQCTYIPSFEDWKMWAMGYNYSPKLGTFDKANKGPQRVDQDILDFLTIQQKNNIESWYEIRRDAQTDKEKGSKIYANPRTWETAANIMYQMLIAKGVPPEERYKIDDNGNKSFNLSKNEKLQAIAQACGMGTNVRKAFQDYEGLKYFTEEKLNNILKYGNLSPEPNELIEDVKNGERFASEKLTSEIIETKNFIPEGDKGRKIHLTASVLDGIINELKKMILSEPEKLNQDSILNFLAYVAVLWRGAARGNEVAGYKKFVIDFLTHDIIDLAKQDEVFGKSELGKACSERAQAAIDNLKPGTAEFKAKCARYNQLIGRTCDKILIWISGTGTEDLNSRVKRQGKEI